MNIEDYSQFVVNSQNLVEAINAASDRVEARMKGEGIDPRNLEHIELFSVINDLIRELIEQQETNLMLYGLYKTNQTND